MLITDMEASTPEPAPKTVPDRMSRDPDQVSHDPLSDVTRPPDTSPTSLDIACDSHNIQIIASPQQSDQSLTDTIANCLQRPTSDNLDRFSDITMTNDSDQCIGDTSDPDSHKSRRSLRHRHRSRNLPERARQKRQTLQDMTRLLKQWLYHHKNNPYPTKAEKMRLALDSQLSLTQVSNWFANARRRLKNTVKDPGLSWGTRIKVYNNHVTGNAELLSISSDDSTWESENEGDATKRESGQQAVKEEAKKSQSMPAPIYRSQEVTGATSAVTHNSHSSHQVAPQDGQIFASFGAQAMQTCTTTGTEAHVASTGLTAIDSRTFVSGQGLGTVPGHSVGPVSKQSHLNPVKTMQVHGGPTVHQSGINLPISVPIQTQSHTVSDRPPGSSPTKTVSSIEGVIPSVTGSPFSPQQHKPLPPLHCDDLTRDGAVSPKYKQTILQRYLHDSCTHSFQIPFSPPSGGGRHRHPSGSVGSFDYEEISSSSRSSPVAMVTGDEAAQDDDLYWLEISAAMALTTLARSRAKHCE